MGDSISIKCKSEKQVDKFVNFLSKLPKVAGDYRPTKGIRNFL